MARETVYIVQAYTQGKRARLAADTPIRCKSPEAARKSAERLATSKAGVVAFSTSGDADLGEYDDLWYFSRQEASQRSSRTNETWRQGDRSRFGFAYIARPALHVGRSDRTWSMGLSHISGKHDGYVRRDHASAIRPEPVSVC